MQLVIAVRGIAAACFLVGLAAPVSAQSSFHGIGRAGDGDSFHVGDRRVRLFGIDAPEFSQLCKRGGVDWRCGAEAAERLSRLIDGKDVRCSSMGTDRHGRTVARCEANGVDVSRMMVSTGYAVAYRLYSTEYVAAEDSARAYKRGIWAGTFEMPSAYRHGDDGPLPERAASAGPSGHGPKVVRAIDAPARTASSGCNIKGNRGRHGWIYHLPGRPYYDETRAEEMFCSEAAAQAAGYRRSRAR